MEKATIALINCAEYMITNLSYKEPVIKYLSVLDPCVQQTTSAKSGLRKLIDFYLYQGGESLGGRCRIMLRQSSLSCALWMNSVFDLAPNWSRYFRRCLPRSLFPSIFPVRASFSTPSLRITWPRNRSCLLRITSISLTGLPTLLKISSFDTCFVQDTFSIRL